MKVISVIIWKVIIFVIPALLKATAEAMIIKFFATLPAVLQCGVISPNLKMDIERKGQIGLHQLSQYYSA